MRIMRAREFHAGLMAGLALLASLACAQTTTYTENFTGSTTTNQWIFLGGACLTAGKGTSLTSPGYIPSCTTLAQPGNYYDSYVGNTSNPNQPFNTSKPFQPLLGGDTGNLPDSIKGGGALRFTNAPTVGGSAGYPDGLFQRGAIISNFTFPLQSQGLHVRFSTETYDPSLCITGKSGISYNQCPGGPYAGTDGADGISFFLQDATQPADVGALGGSLGYSCSNENEDPTVRTSGPSVSTGYQRGYDGLIGGYLGLGIDEGGEFMNGAVITSSTATQTAWDGTQLFSGKTQAVSSSPWGLATYSPGPGPNGFDNTSTGFGWQPGAIGLRGAGSTAFAALNANYPTYYPSSLTESQREAAVKQACTSGLIWNYSQVTANTSQNTGNATLIPGTPTQYIANPYGATLVSPTVTLPNYKAISYSSAIPNAGLQISNLSGDKRGVITPVTAAGYGIPITYDLTISPASGTTPPLLSLSYSYNGGAFQSVITGQDITAASGALPANVRFGFVGSMGGSQNTHELMCFEAAPAPTAGSSAGINVKQTSQLQTDSQVYLAKYNSGTWAGSLTSQYLVADVNNNVTISSTVNWDASCVLTVGYCASTGVTNSTAQGSGSRNILTWSGSAGIPFEWTNLPSTEQAALGVTGETQTTEQYRLNYLRGDRTQELNSSGVGLFRTRTSVLGDIIDSGATWVGPPSNSYPAVWKDVLYPGSGPGENSGQSYPAFAAKEATRTNMVFAGANDGLLHGFRTGAYTAAGVYDPNSANDGRELFAFMPGLVEMNIESALSQNDYSAPQYGHHFDVDAPPGTGDLFYAGAWHTWLVGGLGAGGSAIYALDVTDANYYAAGAVNETSAASIVLGEWSYSPSAGTASFSCAAVANSSTSAANCGLNLGNTYGTPQIKRFHNGDWGVIFGNGFGSSTGDAGVYILLVDSASGGTSIYYLGTGKSGKSDGIANVTAADFDGDHVVDYLYAGDLLGNVWRFDMTSSDPTKWAVQGGSNAIPIFTTMSGQPITSKVIVALVPSTPSTRVMVEFGTGQLTQFTNTAGPIYSSTQQTLYGIWDWNLGTWNSNNSTQYGVLPISGFAAPSALSGTTSLQQQRITSYSSSTDYRTVSSNAICWADTSACSSERQYGWYLALPTGYANASDVNLPSSSPSSSAPSVPVDEQVIYNPLLADGAFIVNTTIPPTNSLASCAATSAGGWTMAINPATGGAFTTTFFNSTSTNTSLVENGVALNGTGTAWLVNSGANTFLVTQTVAGTGTVTQVTPPAGTSGKRLSWTERR